MTKYCACLMRFTEASKARLRLGELDSMLGTGKTHREMPA